MNKNESNKIIGNRIAEIRKIKKMNQGELAGAIDVQPSTIGNYERGIRTIPADLVQPLADALDVPVWLITTGVPDGYGDKYNLQYFVNATADQITEFYNLQSRIKHNNMMNTRDVMYETLTAFTNYIFEENMYTAQYDMFEMAKMIKEKNNYSEIISRMQFDNSDPMLIHFDSFEDYLEKMNIKNVTFDLNDLNK